MASTPSYFSIIPGHIRTCRTIEANAKLLYGEIASLCNVQGYCWASNEYLAEMFDVDRTTIVRWLRSLKEHKFIVVETKVEGIQRSRKIWLSREAKAFFQKSFAKVQKCTDVGAKMHLGGTPSPYYMNNTIGKDIYAQQAAPAFANAPATLSPLLSKKKKQPPIKIEVAPSVWLTEKQQEVILKTCNGDEQKRKECYEICSAWKIENSDDKNDFYRFKKWIYAKYDKLRDAPPEEKRIARNKELSEKVKAKYDHSSDIYVGPSYIEIRTGIYAVNIKYLDADFKKKLIPAIEAKGWGTNWLKEK